MIEKHFISLHIVSLWIQAHRDPKKETASLNYVFSLLCEKYPDIQIEISALIDRYISNGQLQIQYNSIASSEFQGFTNDLNITCDSAILESIEKDKLTCIEAFGIERKKLGDYTFMEALLIIYQKLVSLSEVYETRPEVSLRWTYSDFMSGDGFPLFTTLYIASIYELCSVRLDLVDMDTDPEDIDIDLGYRVTLTGKMRIFAGEQREAHRLLLETLIRKNHKDFSLRTKGKNLLIDRTILYPRDILESTIRARHPYGEISSSIHHGKKGGSYIVKDKKKIVKKIGEK